MDDSRDAPAVVAYVGRGRPVDSEGRLRLEHVDRTFLLEYAPYVDCVVLEEPGGGLSALESLRDRAVPTILYDRTADPAVAFEAIHRGATEYVTDETIGHGTLADLIVAVVERDDSAGNAGTRRSTTALAELRGILGDRTLSFEASIERLLEVGRERFALEHGALAALDGHDYSVLIGDVTVDPGVSVSETICQFTVRTDDPLELPDTAWGPPTAELAEPFARLESYFGDDLHVDDRRYVLWFGSERSRAALSPDERAFFGVLAELLRLELEGTDAVERISERASPTGGSIASDGGGETRSETQSASVGAVDAAAFWPLQETSAHSAAEFADDRSRFRQLFEQLPDAVADVEFRDGEPIVRAVNGAFEETFGYDESVAVDEPLNDLIVPREHIAEAERLDERTILNGYQTAEVERLTAEGRRTFLLRGFCYRRDNAQCGFVIYTNISEQIEQRRRMQVLHRVLRHNLRNEMTVIAGYADMLAEGDLTSESRRFAERIYEEATDVSKLGEQVRRIEQALDVDRRRVAIDPEPLARTIAERFRSRHPEATIRVSTEESAEIVADELLETALSNLVENAIEHHPHEPNVDIVLSAVDGERFDITVRDDGTGIPDREQEIVSGDREITQLDHSRGLGLWVSQWVARGVDGKLLFGDREVGAEVTLRLRRADGTTPE